ncbi:MAG TPA: prolyl oligopeptidase family serine peptidase, partial [Pilimelia sp.]|nr:prolyl oligopeptidase family serine peptidase [Pilimelia sp.]
MTSQLGTAAALGVRVPLDVSTACGAWSPSPAPDGRRVAVVSDRDGVPAAWLLDSATAGAHRLDTGPEPVVRVAWSPDGAWVACVLAPGGAPRTELWVVRPDNTGLRQVAGFGASAATLAGWHPESGALAVTESGPTGCRALLVEPAGGGRELTTGDLVTLLDVSPDGDTALLRQGPRGARWLELLDVPTGVTRPLPAGEGPGSTDRAWFAADGRTVYARTEVAVDLAALVALDVDGGDPVMVARRTDAELEDVVLTADRRTAALLWNRYGGRSEATVLDLTDGERTQRPIPPPAGEVFSDCALATSGELLCFAVQSPVRPRAVWLVDLASGTGRVLGDDPATDATPVGDWSAVVAPQLCDVRSGDGLTISGWLYRPDGEGPWPTVISLHGGPEAQERPGYNPMFQALVARGVAVFAPNVRGSSGFGRAFVEADNLAGRYGAIADVAACVEYLVATSVASPGKVGCMGRSYGGYLTLMSLVTFPELFAVGVSECGMSDFGSFYQETEPWIAAAAVSKYGDPVHDRELLHDLSPLHRLDRLAAPLLLVHGA